MAGKIMMALATLVREAWMDEVPSEAVLDNWKALAVDARHEYDKLRADLAAVTKERDELLAWKQAHCTHMKQDPIFHCTECGADSPCRVQNALEEAEHKTGVSRP